MINSILREEEVYSNNSGMPLPDFGVDYDGPLPEEEDGTIEIPPTVCPLDDSDLEEFTTRINTDTIFEDFGFQHFIECLLTLLNNAQ